MLSCIKLIIQRYKRLKGHRISSREEYETTGIDYWTVFGKTFVNANSWITTENALRREHGLPERIRYQ